MHVVVMGVSGSGKSTLAETLADRLGMTLVEADQMHVPEAVEKMRSGTPLTDEDRWPWLDRIAERSRQIEGDVVIACSALRKVYRDRLREGLPGLKFVHLDGDFETLAARMRARKHHFMPASLLRSQCDTLEDPAGEPLVWKIALNRRAEDVADELAADEDFMAGAKAHA